MLNIQLPDISKLEDKYKIFVNFDDFNRIYNNIIKNSNMDWNIFKQKSEIKEFIEKYPNMGIYIYSAFLVTKNNYNNRHFSKEQKRKFGNEHGGTPEQQFYGILGQNVLSKYFYNLYPTNRDNYIPSDKSCTFDGGYDYIINGKKVDLKISTRSCDFNMEYVHNLHAAQVDSPNYECDFYLFASFNKKTNLLQICAIIPKEAVKLYAKYFDMDSNSYNSYGKKIGGSARYEIKDYILSADWAINNFDDISIKLEKNKNIDINSLGFNRDSYEIAELVKKADKGNESSKLVLEAYKECYMSKIVQKSETHIFTEDFYMDNIKSFQKDIIQLKINNQKNFIQKETISKYSDTNNKANPYRDYGLKRLMEIAKENSLKSNKKELDISMNVSPNKNIQDCTDFEYRM